MMSRRTPVFFMLLLMCVLQIMGGLSTKDVNSVNNEIGVAIDKRGVKTLKNMLKEVSPHADKLLTNILERFRRDDTSNSNEGGVKISEKQVREALTKVANNKTSEVTREAVEQITAKLREYENRVLRQERSGVSGKDPAVVINNEAEKMIKRAIGGESAHGPSGPGNVDTPRRRLVKKQKLPADGDHIKEVGVHIQGGESKSHTSSSESNSGSITISENTVRDLLKALTTIAQSVFKTDLLQRLLGLPGRPTRHKRFSEVVAKKQGTPNGLVINFVSTNKVTERVTSNTATISISHSALMGILQLIPMLLEMLKGNMGPRETPQPSAMVAEEMAEKPGCKDRSGQTPLIQDIQAVSGGRYKGVVGYYVFTKSNIYFLTKPDMCTNAKHVLISELTGDEFDKIPEVVAAFRVSGPDRGPDRKDYVYLVMNKALPPPQVISKIISRTELTTPTAPAATGEQDDCPSYCTQVVNKVCGYNKDTAKFVLFSNECYMNATACENKTSYAKVNMSKCPSKTERSAESTSPPLTELTTPARAAASKDQESYDCQFHCTQEGNKVCGYNKDTAKFVLFSNECHMNEAACREKTAYFKVYMCKCQPSSEVDAYEVWVIKQTPFGVSVKVGVTKSSCIFPMEDYVWGHITSITALNATTLLLIGDVKCKENHTCPETNTEGAFYKIQLGHNNAFEFIEFMDIHSEWNVDAFRFIEKDVSSGDMESQLIYNGGASLGTLSADGLFVPHGREQAPSAMATAEVGATQ